MARTIVLAVLCAFALAPPAAAQPLAERARAETPAPTPGRAPALWRVADDDTVIWLFGTIHVLPPDFAWRNALIDAAIDSADTLVLESVSDNPSEGALLLMELGAASDLPPIGERVAADRLPALASMIARGPFPESYLSGFETWAATLLLVGVALNDLGLDPDSGVETSLEAQFEAAGRPVIGLETAAEQLGYFDMLPEPAQRHFLGTVVETADEIRAQFQAMLDAWITGDEAAIAESFDDDLSMSPALRAALLTDRNARWADWIAARLDEPGTVFVAVGAGHLVGQGSVQDYLAARGARAQRVQ